MAAYKVVFLDTAAVLDHAPIDGPNGNGFLGSQIDYITVLQVPVGANVLLHIGQTGDGIPLTVPIPFDICPPETTGIKFSVPVAGAGLVVLLVSFLEGSVAGGAI